MDFKHFLISRFNLRPEGRPLATEEWMNRRWTLFKNYCWPSVQHQTNQSFIWLMFFDVQTADLDRKIIAELQVDMPQFEAVFIDGAASFNTEVIKIVKTLSAKGHSHVITTRLDNDDAIHEDFIERIQKEFKGQDQALIDPISGYSFSSPKPSLLARIEKPFNPFMSLIEKNGPELTTVSTRNHDHWTSFQNRVKIEGEPLWMQIIHGENQASQFGHHGWLVKGGYLSRDFDGLELFHLRIDVDQPPSVFFRYVYNIKVRIYHMKRQFKSLIKGEMK